MFGKSWLEYLRFERWILAAILIVGAARLALSLADAPTAVVRLLSVTVVAFFGAVYCGMAGARFGTYRHLLPLVFLQAVLVHAITVAGIAVAYVTGVPNAFTAPEYSRLPNYLPHATGHIAGMVVWPLVMWPIASLVMWVTKAVRG